MFKILIFSNIKEGYHIILLKKWIVKRASFGVKSRFRSNLWASTVDDGSLPTGQNFRKLGSGDESRRYSQRPIYPWDIAYSAKSGNCHPGETVSTDKTMVVCPSKPKIGRKPITTNNSQGAPDKTETNPALKCVLLAKHQFLEGEGDQYSFG